MGQILHLLHVAIQRYFILSVTRSGAVLEGFLRFLETTQDFPSTMGAPPFGYNIS